MRFTSVFYAVFKTLGSWLLVFIVYHFAAAFIEQMRKESKFWSIQLWNSRTGKVLAYPFFVFWVAVVSLVLWANYGTHTEDDDPLRGGGETVVDFEPYDRERNEYGLEMFFVLGIPTMVAVYNNYRKHPVKRGDSSLESSVDEF